MIWSALSFELKRGKPLLKPFYQFGLWVYFEGCIEGCYFLKTPVTFFFSDKAYATGKLLCERLKDAIPRQLFEIAIQAAIGKRIIARET